MTPLDLLFPPRCAFCGCIMEEAGDGVCGRCREDLPRREGDAAFVEIPGVPCAAAFYYEDAVRSGVLALKFEKKSWRARVFGRYIAQAAAALPGPFDAVVFAPVSRLRRFTRGFDQGALLARTVSETLALPLLPVLRKVRHTRPQSSLEDPEARRENAEGAYAVSRPAAVFGRRLLLIDDVVTTGSTLAACASALRIAGAGSVSCAVLAGGHRG